MKVLGGIMVAFGILLAGGSGLCTLSIIFEEMGSPSADATGWIVLAAIIGGVPFLMGLGSMIGGMVLLREKPRE